jgi:hypothetical protein
MLENTKGLIKKWQSKETCNIDNKHKTKQNRTKHNTICYGHHYAQLSTNNASKTWALLQTTGGKEERNIIPIRKCVDYHFQCH